MSTASPQAELDTLDFANDPPKYGGALPIDLTAAFNAAWDCATLGNSLGDRFLNFRYSKPSRGLAKLGIKIPTKEEQQESRIRYLVQLARQLWSELPRYQAAIESVQAELNAIRDRPARCGKYVATNAHLIALQVVQYFVKYLVPPTFAGSVTKLTDEFILKNYTGWHRVLELHRRLRVLISTFVLSESSLDELLCEMRLVTVP
jgi:hypothetical protein